MTRTLKAFAAAAVLAFGATLTAQTAVPEIPFESVADLLKAPVAGPTAVFVGEVGGVGQNSRGLIFVYTRTGHPYATIGDNRTFSRGGSRLLVFDRTGKYETEWGQDVYGFNSAIGLRVDPQDNVWTIDEAANQVVKFDPQGRVALVLGRKPETISVRPERAGAAAVDVAGRKQVAADLRERLLERAAVRRQPVARAHLLRQPVAVAVVVAVPLVLPDPALPDRRSVARRT